MSRRNGLAGAAAAGGAMAADSGVAAARTPQPARLAPVVGGKTALSPDEALKLLIEGNQNFLNDVPTAAFIGRERRLEIAQGQAPFATYVTCSESRVSPEILFGRGLGELFIIRNAGNTVDTVALGSIEYNGPSYVAGDLADYLAERDMRHVCGAPFHPQTQGKIER